MAMRHRSLLNQSIHLEKAELARKSFEEILRKAPPTSDEYRAARGVVEAIDRIAEAVTGDRQHFHLKMAPAHSQPKGR